MLFRSKAVVEIKDNGVGIEPDEQKKVFHPFQTSRLEGAGLGLTMTFRIIADHSGDITVKSVKHEGTVMTISLGAVRETQSESAPELAP